jgi:MFS family permease
VLLLAVPDPRPAHEVSVPGTWGTVLADRQYRLLVATQLGYSLAMMVLNFAIPVYAVTVLGLPGWITGAVFVINTVMIGFGQGLVVLAMTGRVRWRILVLCQLVFAASWLLFLIAGEVSAVAAVALVLVGSVVYTGGELLGGPVLGALSAEAAPAYLRGRYLSLIQLAWNLAGTVSPVAMAWLLDRGTTPLWWVMFAVSGMSVVTALVLGRRMPKAALRVTNRAEATTV